MPPTPDPMTYTVEEAARLLRIGRNQAYEAARTGELPTLKIGKRILVPRVALDQMLASASRTAGPPTEAAPNRP